MSMLAEPALQRMRHIACALREAGPLARELPECVEMVALNVRGRSFLSAPRLARVIARHRPQVVHARNWGTWIDAVVACRLVRGGRPAAVLGFHGLEADTGFSVRRRRWAQRFGLASRRFTAVCHAGAEQLGDELNVPADRISVLESGVDASRFRAASRSQRIAIRDRLGIGPSERVVIMVGSLVTVKDHDAAIRAVGECARRVGRVRLLVVGDGPLRADLEAQARDLHCDARVDFLGIRGDIDSLLRVADVYISSSRYEQMSNAVMEAMAAEVPVVATDVGDHARLIRHDRTGIIVPRRDPVALARALAGLLTNPGKRRALGEAARDRIAEQFDLPCAAERYACYYESIVAEQAMEGAARCAALPA